MKNIPDPQLPEHGPGEAAAVDPDLLEVFRQETEGHLQAIRVNLPALGQGGAEVVQAIRRAAHTLKGSAAMVGFRSLTRLAHRMEDLLDRMHEGLAATPEMIDLLNASANRLEDLAAGQEDASLDGLYTRYDGLFGAEEAAPGARRRDPSPARATESSGPGRAARETFVRASLQRLDELVRLVSELTIVRTTFEQRLTAGQTSGPLDDDMEGL